MGIWPEFQDLRYTFPDERGRTPLGGFVVLSPGLHVLDEGMNSSKSPSVDSLGMADTSRDVDFLSPPKFCCPR